MKSPLRRAREQAGQTIVEVCKAVSADPGNLSRVENGKQKPSTELAERLAKHFGAPLTEMQILYPERYAPSDLELGPDRPARSLPSGKNIMEWPSCAIVK